jgi:hypothetical protein
MSWKICLKLPSLPKKVGITLRKEVCFYIPILVRKFPDDPGPWITKGFIDEKLAKDLPVLATIDALASQLSNATVRKTVQRTIQGAVDTRSLPENMKLEFK